MRPSRGDLLRSRFWTKVNVSEQCWEWMGGANARGYGQLKVEGRMRLAHRVAWDLASGPIPQGIDVLHHCDNPPCVRVSHLFLGTQRDNARDMVAKGRGLTPEQQAAITRPRGDDHWSRRHPELVRRGEHHHKAKMNAAKVRELRALSAGGATLRQVAEQFGIGTSNASYIVRRETWRDVP